MDFARVELLGPPDGQVQAVPAVPEDGMDVGLLAHGHLVFLRRGRIKDLRGDQGIQIVLELALPRQLCQKLSIVDGEGDEHDVSKLGEEVVVQLLLLLGRDALAPQIRQVVHPHRVVLRGLLVLVDGLRGARLQHGAEERHNRQEDGHGDVRRALILHRQAAPARAHHRAHQRHRQVVRVVRGVPFDGRQGDESADEHHSAHEDQLAEVQRDADAELVQRAHVAVEKIVQLGLFAVRTQLLAHARQAVTGVVVVVRDAMRQQVLVVRLGLLDGRRLVLRRRIHLGEALQGPLATRERCRRGRQQMHKRRVSFPVASLREETRGKWEGRGGGLGSSAPRGGQRNHAGRMNGVDRRSL
eukprot:scaffold293_cov248-Pinguiococcus_pyrenoidosus.AAC.6